VLDQKLGFFFVLEDILASNHRISTAEFLGQYISTTYTLSSKSHATAQYCLGALLFLTLRPIATNPLGTFVRYEAFCNAYMGNFLKRCASALIV
jgi:hypothetical protein